MADEPVFHEPVQQVAALCWRARPLPEMLLITSLDTRRWILPKGWPVKGMSLARSAAIEAHEEAGVTGEVRDTALGDYLYLKERKGGSAIPCRVSVFALKVTRQDRNFAEKGARELCWLPVDEAAHRVAEPELRHILLAFRKSLTPARHRA